MRVSKFKNLIISIFFHAIIILCSQPLGFVTATVVSTTLERNGLKDYFANSFSPEADHAPRQKYSFALSVRILASAIKIRINELAIGYSQFSSRDAEEVFLQGEGGELGGGELKGAFGDLGTWGLERCMKCRY